MTGVDPGTGVAGHSFRHYSYPGTYEDEVSSTIACTIRFITCRAEFSSLRSHARRSDS